jgi:sugar phosphate isomerase/epimerase
MVSFSNRFSPAVLLAKRLIEQGKIGEVNHFRATFLQDWLIDPVIFIQELGDRILHVHGKDGEIVEHNVKRSDLQPTGKGDRIDRGFRFRVPGWGSVPWKRIMTELALVGYNYVVSYEHEDVVISREDGIKKSNVSGL